MSQMIHVYGPTGHLGTEDRPVAKRATTLKPNDLIINEADWDTRNLLMPIFVREVMQNQQQQTADQELLHRDYAPEPDSNILLPIGVGE